MKYWVYKDARILGPYDREGLSGLPGVSAATLVCPEESESSREGDWRPAGDVADLAPLALGSVSAWPDDVPSTHGLLDALQIETAGLVADDDFPEAAENLFQDAEMKRALGDLLGPAAAEDSLRREKERSAELGDRLQKLLLRVERLETAQADLLNRLAQAQARGRQEETPPPEPLPARQEEEPPLPEPSAVERPTIAPAPEPPGPGPAPVEIPALAPAKPVFTRGTFKIVGEVKSLRVVDDDREASAEPAAPPPARGMPGVPAPAAAPAPAPERPRADVAAPAPPLTLTFGGMAQPEAAAPTPTPTSSFSGSYEDFSGGGDAAAPAPAAPASSGVPLRLAKPAVPDATTPRRARSGAPFLIAGGAMVALMGAIGFLLLRQPKDLRQMTALDDGRARLGAEPVDDESRVMPPTPAAPPLMPAAPSLTPAAPPLTPAAPPPAPDKSAAAVALVKDFPLDGERGTVSKWLEYSYSASPGAGQESWNASKTGDAVYLVEYRFTPAARDAAEVHYLFEADLDRGFVIGKSLDARSLLAGGARSADATAKPAARAPARRRSRPRRAARPGAARRAVAAARAAVPLLPLPRADEPRPPSEDGNAFAP